MINSHFKVVDMGIFAQIQQGIHRDLGATIGRIDDIRKSRCDGRVGRDFTAIRTAENHSDTRVVIKIHIVPANPTTAGRPDRHRRHWLQRTNGRRVHKD